MVFRFLKDRVVHFAPEIIFQFGKFLAILLAMKPLDDFETESVEDILLLYQAQACDVWRAHHAEGASPTERELHELTEALLARRIFELQNSRAPNIRRKGTKSESKRGD